MTQPYQQPQQYPPGYGAYAPPAQPQQYGQPYPGVPGVQPPQGYPGAVVSYPAPPQQPPAAQPVPQATSPAGGQALGPGAAPALVNGGGGGGGSVAPKMRHLVGRTIIVEPVRMSTTQVKGKDVDEAVFHLTVVDGGPVRYGDNVDDRDPSKNRPNTHERDTPCRFTNASDIGFGFVQAVRDSLDAGELARVGVVEQGTQGNRPYLITKCETTLNGTERPDGGQRMAAANDLWNKIWQDKHAAPGAPRQFVSPEARSLVAPPSPAQQSYGQPQVNYGAPAAAPQRPAYAQPQGYPAQPQQYAPPVQPQTAPNGYYMPPAQPSAPPAAAAEPDVSHLPPPVQQWLASLDPATRAASLPGVLAQYGAAAQPQQQLAAPAGPGI